MKAFWIRLYWLHRARPLTLTFFSQGAILALCLILGLLCSLLTVESTELLSYLALSFSWMFGLILFCDFGGHFNDNARHMTFWMNFMPSKALYLCTLMLSFLWTAFVFSLLGIVPIVAMHASVLIKLPTLASIFQSILHQTIGLTLVAVFNYALGTWTHRGMRQIVCMTWVIVVFFLSSILPHFFAFNNIFLNLVFEILPRIDLYDNRTSLLVAQTAFPWEYTGTIGLYALGQFLFLGVVAWFKLYREGWK